MVGRRRKMKLPQIKIYIGKVSQWEEIYKGEKRAETICGRLLLLYGLLQMEEGYELFMSDTPQKAYCKLEERFTYGVHGKPGLSGSFQTYFNISHSGKYAVCALSKIPCGVDVQEKKELKNLRIFDKTLSEIERKEILVREDKTDVFYEYWTRKESYLKLTGKGITVDLREIPKPIWYEKFRPEEGYIGCVSAERKCEAIYQYVLPDDLLKLFS